MKRLLTAVCCLIAAAGFAQKGKSVVSADFYGVDFSCVSVIGAAEEPGAFIQAFKGIIQLFLSEPKKYDVGGFTAIDILSTNIETATESVGGLAAEQFMPRREPIDWQTQLPGIISRYNNGSGNMGLLLIADTLDKGNGSGQYIAVLFDPATGEILRQCEIVGKPGGFGLRNFWAGSLYNALRKEGGKLMR